MADWENNLPSNSEMYLNFKTDSASQHFSNKM